MAIGVPNAGTATTFTAATTSAVPFPAATHKGSVLVLSWAQFAAGSTVTTPGGWTLREYVQGTAGTTAGNVAVFWKVADGTEGGTNLTVTHGSATAEAQIVEWPGVDPNVPFDVADSTFDDTASSATTVIPALTVATPGATLGYASSSNTAAQTAGTLPSGFTQLSNGTGASCNMLSGYKQSVGAGSSGTVTVTYSGAGKHVSILYALRPDIVAPTQQTPRKRFPLPFLRRGRAAQPVRTSAVTPPTAQALPPQSQRAAARLAWLRRPRPAASLPVPGVAAGPPLLGRARHAAPTRRRGATALPITLPLLTGDASSFEASQGGWTASTGAPTLATSATQHFTGTQSLKATATATGTLGVASPNVFGIVPGSYLRVHAWVYCETNARTLLFQLNWKTASGGTAGFTSGSTVGGTLGGWTQVTFSGLVPSTPGITGLSLLVLATSVAISDVFYVDDADVEVVSFTAPSFTPQWWNQVTRRRVQMPPRRGRGGTQVPTPTPTFPPQPDTPHPTSPRRRRATFAQPLPVTAPSAVPLLGDTRRAVIPPPLVRRLRSRFVVPSTTPVVTTQALPPQPSLRRRALTPLRRVRSVFVIPTTAPVATPTPPFVARARHAAPPLPRRRRLVLTPARVPQPPPLVMRARHASPPMRRRVLAAFTPFPVSTSNSWLRTVTDLLGLTDFMSVTYTTDGTHGTPTGTTTPPPHTLNPLFEPGQWLYGNATPNRNRRPPLASRKDPPQQ